MLDHIQFDRQTDTALYLSLKDPSMLEGGVFARMENDEYALGCMVVDEKKGQLMYATQNLLPLSAFMRAYTFEKQEGYLFLINILEKVIAVNRSKPVLLDTDFIFVSPSGDEVYFVVLPLALEFWMFQKDECLCLMQEFLDQMKCQQCYELPGYIVQFMKSDAFSLPGLVNGLKTLMDAYYPRKLFRKRMRTFRASSPVHASLYDPDMIIGRTSSTMQDSVRSSRSLQKDLQAASFSNSSPVTASRHDSSRPDYGSGRSFSDGLILADSAPGQVYSPVTKDTAHQEEQVYTPAQAPDYPEWVWSGAQDEPSESREPQRQDVMLTEPVRQLSRDEIATTWIGPQEEQWGTLEIANQVFPLKFEVCSVGRHASNDICLSSSAVSSRHARIIKEDGQYFVQDLKSTNRTWIFDRPILGKERLREGMSIRFGDVEGIFHESAL